MTIRFRAKPGAHERRLIRQAENPLYPSHNRELDQRTLDVARIQDDNEVRTFETQLRDLVQRCVDLPPTSESDVVLGLKEELDKLYEQCSGLTGDIKHYQEAINQLIALMMAAVRKGAEQDHAALERLEAEDTARSMHQEYLRHPIISDLLRESGGIAEDELVATLLGEQNPTFEAAWSLFSAEQQQLMLDEAEQLRAAVDPNSLDKAFVSQLDQRLGQMRRSVAHNRAHEPT